MDKPNEPPPSDILYIIDGERLGQLEQVAAGLDTLLKTASEKPDAWAPEITSCFQAMRDLMTSGLGSLYVSYDPRWSAEDDAFRAPD